MTAIESSGTGTLFRLFLPFFEKVNSALVCQGISSIKESQLKKGPTTTTTTTTIAIAAYIQFLERLHCKDLSF
jgi:hypothetical protein